MQVFQQYPTPNDPGVDGYNLVGYRFAAPIKNAFNTAIGRADYHAGNQNFFGRLNFQDDSVETAPQYSGQAPRNTRKTTSRGFAFGWDSVLASNKVNTFRYGLTQIKEDIVGLQTKTEVDFRNIDSFDALTASSGRDIPDARVRGRLLVGQGIAHAQVRDEHAVQPRRQLQQRELVPPARGERVVGVRSRTALYARRHCPGVESACDALPAVAEGGQSTYGDTLIPILGIISEVDGYFNYDTQGNVLPEGTPVRRRFGSDEYQFYVQDSWKMGQNFTLTAGVRYSLYSPPWEVNGLQVSPSINLGDWFETRRTLMDAGQSSSDAPLIQFDLAGPKNNKPGYYNWDKNNFAPRLAAAWTPTAD